MSPLLSGKMRAPIPAAARTTAAGPSPDLGVYVVVPAFNEELTIGAVIQGLRRSGFERILVVDDGSSDRTAISARRAGAEIVTHVINRGLGAALGTGIRAALARGARVIVTCDADGQHAPADVRGALGPVLAGDADVVIGSRLLGDGNMPWRRRVANRLANVCTLFLFRMWTTDSQSGLRVFSRHAAESLHLDCDGMEVSSEIAGEIARNGLRCAEVPITSIYTEYSLSKGQSFHVGLKTLGKLVFLKATGRR